MFQFQLPDNLCLQCGDIGPSLHRYLPAMRLYVCTRCIKAFAMVPIKESDIDNKVVAPWTAEQVASLQEYQTAAEYAPFVCPADHIFTAAPEGLVCFQCRKEQLLNSDPMHLWAYDWTLDWSWKEL